MKTVVLVLMAPIFLVQAGMVAECACIGCDGHQSACSTGSPNDDASLPSCCTPSPPAGPTLGSLQSCKCLHLTDETFPEPDRTATPSPLNSAPLKDLSTPGDGADETPALRFFLPYNDWAPPPPLRIHLLNGIQLS